MHEMSGEEVHSGTDDEENSNESTELRGFLSKWTNCECNRVQQQ